MNDRIINEYFDWLYDLVAANRFAKENSYRKLLSYLHSTEFRYSIPKDANRASDGADLRWRFLSKKDETHLYYILKRNLPKPCSVLEMMVALAVRCEESIMDNPSMGDRTGQWFWGMITNLGLGSMMDERFDEQYVEGVVERFLDRRYEPTGKGGLFTVRNSHEDLREVEIWYQLCWYLDNIT